MSKWLCTKCGYIYNEDSGDLERHVPVNTPFEKVDPNWVCPRCKAEKYMFKKTA